MKASSRNLLRQLTATVLVGLTAGAVASLFHAALSAVFGAMVLGPSGWPFPLFLVGVVILMASGAFATGWLMTRFAPDAPGSGIPQVKVAYAKGGDSFSPHLPWVKFVGGVLSIGTGSSLGREGPTIHIGAAVAARIAGWFGEDQAAKKNALCAGSAAGLAAAFGSPLAGVTLVLEEIAGGRDEAKFAGRALLAAALAAAVVAFFGNGKPSLYLGPDLPLNWKALWLSPVVALCAGGAGILFQWATLGLRKASKQSRLPVPARLALGAAAAGLVSAAAFGLTGNPGAFGLGEAQLQEALRGNVLWLPALVLLFAKLLSTVTCYGTGGCGGIFAPIIFFGGMAGLAVHGLAAFAIAMGPADATLLGLVGMTACLAAVVRAPITSILIVVEMTRQLQVLPALMVAAVIGVYLNRLCFRRNFYDEAIEQDKSPGAEAPVIGHAESRD